MPEPLGLLARCLLVLALAGCAAPRPAGVPPAGRTVLESIEHEGFTRSYRLHLPARADPRGAPALLVVIHGGGGDSEGMEEVTGFSRIADREGFIVVYPDGLGVLGWAQAWNAGHCCGRGHVLGVDDVGLLRRLIHDLSARLGVDRERVFVVGYSNGALLAYRAGSELSDQVAGIAPYAGTMRARAPLRAPRIDLAPPRRPVSVFATHATADPRIPYEGIDDGAAVDVSFAHAGRFWAVASGCTGRPSTRSGRAGAVRIDAYPGCASGAAVEQVTLSGWDHEWPGPANTGELPADHPLHGFDLAEEIWRFFASQRRAPVSSRRSPH